MVNSNSKNQTKVGESYSQYRLAKKHGDGSKIAKRAALVCSIAMLVIIFFVYIFGSLGGGYKEGTLFSHELIAVQNNDGKWGYLNKTGQIMIDFEYDNALNFTENGLALVSKDGKWGFIDINGKMAISADYEEAMPFKYGVAIVKKDGKYGFIDGKGNVISKDPVSKTAGFCYSTIYDFEQEYSSKKIYAIAGYEVENEVKYGVIDNGGNVVIDFAYEELGYADENVGESKRIGNGLISYKIGGSWGYMTYEGVTKTSAIYDRAYAFDENKMAIVEATVGADGYFIVYLNEETGRIMNAYDETNVSFIDRFENGYYRVLNTDGKYGLFARNTDKNAAEICKQVINPEYTYLEYGNDDLLIYSKGEDALTRKYGFMNYSGENRTDEIYLSARVAGDKLVTTKENDDNEIETSVMNSNLTVAFTFVCDELSDFKNGFAIFEKNSLFGYVREDGKVIYEATLLYADEFKADGFAVARTDDGYGVLNDNGKWQIGAIYQNVSHFTF